MADSLIDIARRAAELAKRKGANEAAAGVYRARHVEVSWRDGKLEKVTEATTRSLGLDLYVDGRYAAVSTSDLRPEALERFIGDSVTLARTLVPDPYRQLPDPALYQGQAALDLELADPRYGELDTGRRRQAVEAAEAAARSVKGAEAILSVSTGASDTQGESAIVQTNGFEGSRRSTDFWVAAEVAVKDPDGRRPEEYASSGARHIDEVEAPEVVGRRAGERAVSRIGAVKGASGAPLHRGGGACGRKARRSPFRPALGGFAPAEAVVPGGKAQGTGRERAARHSRRSTRRSGHGLAPLRR